MKIHLRSRGRTIAHTLIFMSLASRGLAAPPTDIVTSPTQPILAPAAASGTLVSTLSSTDVDALDTHTYTFVDAPAPSPVITAGSTWKYLDTNVDPGAGWDGSGGFDDSGWSTGVGAIGYGDPADQTTVTTATPQTMYFRGEFTIADVSQISGLNVGVRRDDGAVVYINGVEAFRQNMPAGVITHTTFSAGTTPDELGFFNETITDLTPFSLIDGANEIAVSVHQASAGSSDLTFDLTLDELIPSDPLDNASFTISGNELRSAVANAKAEGETYMVRIRSEDSGLESYEEQFTVITTGNTAPVASDATFSVPEGSLVHTVVGTVTATDTDNFTYAITGGNVGGAFSINPETGEIKVDRYLPNQIDFETTPTYALIVSIADDGTPTPLTANVTITVNVTDIDESPVFGAVAAATVEPMAAVDTEVATVLATDPEGLVVTHSITTGNTGSAFKIDGTTGVISVNTPAALDPAVNPEFNLEITATDGASTVSTVILHIDVASVLFGLDAGFSYLVPSSGDDDLTWFTPAFDDSTWTPATGGIGYDSPAADPNYNTIYATDVSSASATPMEGVNASIYIRYDFTVATPANIGSLQMRANYEDGFVAYLNGVEVARRAAPALLSWNSQATDNRGEAGVYILSTIDLSPFISQVVAGNNVLAIHALNSSPTSSDFVFKTELVSTSHGSASSPVAPQVTLGAANAITQTSARFPVTVNSTGGAAPTVTLYYGETNGGETPLDWDANMPLGALNAGTYNPVVASLTAGNTYFYAISATNAAGTVWIAGPGTGNFITATPPSVFPVDLVGESAAVKYKVPTDASEDATWFTTGFNASAWTDGTMGVGYETGTGYAPYIGSDVIDQMEDRETSVYVRAEFTTAVSTYDNLSILARYDDAFVVYLNGVEVLRVNTTDAPLGFESFCEVGHEAGANYETFDITDIALPLLSTTTPNILAIHGINQSLSSSDMLIDVKLVGSTYDFIGNNSPPVVQTDAPVGVSQNQASANGSFTSFGGATNAQVVLFYGTADGGTNPVAWENEVDIGIQGGAFTSVLTGLDPATNYFYNVYAYNDAGLSWASTQSFFTTGTTLPVIASNDELVVDADSVTLNGTLSDIGGDSNTQVTVAWGSTDGGATLGSWENQLNLGVLPVGVVSYTLDNIAPNSTVFYRYFATNAAGTSAAPTSISFSTPVIIAALDLEAAMSITTTSADINGTLTEDGGDPPVVVIHYGTRDGGTDAIAWENNVSLGATSGGPISTTLTGLTPSQQYFYRAAATNSVGTAWSPVSRMFFAGQTVILDQGATASYLVPVDATDDATWFTSAFDASAWATGPTGVGYDEAVTYVPLIGSDIETDMNNGVATSAFIRINFNVADKSLIQGLVLNMKHDDGMVAYLNGVEVARDRAVGISPLTFDATADANRDDALLDEYEAFDISANIVDLVNGTNLLAIHGLNTSATSSDFVVLPQIISLADPIPAADDFTAWVEGYPTLIGPDALPTADPDLDGIVNLLEYAFGGDPTVPGGTAGGAPLLPNPAVTADIGGDFFEITYRRRLDYQDRSITYGVELSPDLAAPWVASIDFTQQGAAVPAGDGVTEFVTLRSNAPISQVRQFGRISVTAN